MSQSTGNIEAQTLVGFLDEVSVVDKNRTRENLDKLASLTLCGYVKCPNVYKVMTKIEIDNQNKTKHNYCFTKGYYCDKCNISLKNEIMWFHCGRNCKIEGHENGVDVCSTCVINWWYKKYSTKLRQLFI